MSKRTRHKKRPPTVDLIGGFLVGAFTSTMAFVTFAPYADAVPAPVFGVVELDSAAEKLGERELIALQASRDLDRVKRLHQVKVAERKERRAAREAAAQEAQAVASTPTPAPSAFPVSGNRALGQKLMLARWGMDQWSCLDALWTRESGWNHLASNPSSGAYGIPQALPGSKMAVAGSDWATNPVTQIKWGLSYLSSRYGSPCGGWSHSQAYGWY